MGLLGSKALGSWTKGPSHVLVSIDFVVGLKDRAVGDVTERQPADLDWVHLCSLSTPTLYSTVRLEETK